MTIICDDYRIEGETISIDNIQIVNGAQTTSSLTERFKHNEKDMDEVSLMARIIKVADNEDLVEKIREYNNKQNPTKVRDFVSHEPIQRKIQKDFEDLGYFYEISRGEKNEPRVDKHIRLKRLDIVDNVTVAQAYCSFIGKPAEAKSRKNDLLIPSDEFYKLIFSKQITSQALLFAYLCYEEAKSQYLKFKREHKEGYREEDAYLLNGTTHLVCLMGMISSKTTRLADHFNDPKKFSKLTDPKYISPLYEQAKELLADLYADKLGFYASEGKLLVASKFFKSAGDSAHLFKQAESRIDRKKDELKSLMNSFLH